MKKLPDISFDLVVTSPPYNLNNSVGSGMKLGSRGSSKWSATNTVRGGYNEHEDNMPHKEYVAWQRECLTEMLRLTKDTGAIFYNHKWRVQSGQLQDRQDIVQGFPVRQIIIWDRMSGFNFNPGYFLPTYEVIYLIAKPKFKLKTKANARGDVWQINFEQNTPHPAPFPTQLVDIILNSCCGNRVLDPFLGSGTTAVSAKQNGWDCVGIEKSKEYCDMATERLLNTTTQLF